MVATDRALVTLLDPSQSVPDRVAAVGRLEGAEQLASIEALIRVAQQVDVPAKLAVAVGRMLGQFCFQRREDIHELDLAMFSDAAGDAYDQEIGRLERLEPDVHVRRSGAGPGR